MIKRGWRFITKYHCFIFVISNSRYIYNKDLILAGKQSEKLTKYCSQLDLHGQNRHAKLAVKSNISDILYVKYH